MARKMQPEEYYDFEDEPVEEDAHAAAEEPRALLGSGAFTSAVLLLTGFGFVAFGVSLQLAPKIAWPLVQVQETLAVEGASPFLIALTGFVAFGFGLVHRAARRPHVHVVQPVDTDEQPDFNLVATEFAGGLHRVQETIEGLGRRLAIVSQAQRQLQETFHAQSPNESAGADSNEAIFRLAAGLDKLHAQIDQQVSGLTQRTEADSRAVVEKLGSMKLEFQSVQELVNGLVGRVQELPSQITSHAAAFGSPQATTTPVAPALPAPTPQASKADLPPHAAASTNIYTALPVVEPVTEDAQEETIDADRMVQEGLEVLVQLEEGLQPHADESPDEQSQENAEFLRVVAELGAANAQATPLPEPPPALPSPRPTKDDALEALLPDDAIRDALGEGH